VRVEYLENKNQRKNNLGPSVNGPDKNVLKNMRQYVEDYAEILDEE
jgi:hypothetical protein